MRLHEESVDRSVRDAAARQVVQVNVAMLVRVLPDVLKPLFHRVHSTSAFPYCRIFFWWRRFKIRRPFTDLFFFQVDRPRVIETSLKLMPFWRILQPFGS